ncbi:SDR family oxidoreductase [Roseomonas chloroacetimidivorans]|uniref:SDR family oxidoreductase n=1 Tax=Roseomonas chloroacetimidivorans TaxID=1766656 RepID=UPI003C774224
MSGQFKAAFERVRAEWGGLDLVLHSIAFGPREVLHGRVTGSSAGGFGIAMDCPATRSFGWPISPSR